MLIVDVLKEAKEFLLKSTEYVGMCKCFKCVCALNSLKYNTIYCIKRNIPEFNYLYLTGSKGMDVPIYDYWWYICDKQSRIEAFDKLINLYKNSDK